MDGGMKWFESESEEEGEDGDASDIDDVPKDMCGAHSEHESDSAHSDYDDDDDEIEMPEQPEEGYFYGRNGVKWSKTPVNDQPGVRTDTQSFGLKAKAETLGDKPDPLSVWRLLFSDEIMNKIIQWTNKKFAMKRSQSPEENNPDLNDVDMIELKAFIGLFIYMAYIRNDVISYMYDKTMGPGTFRATMTLERFQAIMSCLRFDNSEDREERKKANPAAAISDFFEEFLKNCQDCYQIGPTVCVDEMLVPFKGCCSFKYEIAVPYKQTDYRYKYGIKVMCLVDTHTKYLYNAYIDCVKDTAEGFTAEERKFPMPTQAVLRLTRPLYDTQRTVTADSWFSSIELAEVLMSKGLKYVGSIEPNKRDIPKEFLPIGKREVKSTIYGFKDNLTLLSYASGKRRVKLLISSASEILPKNAGKHNRPEMLTFYNNAKGSVEMLDYTLSEYSRQQHSYRWSISVFLRMLDLSVYNAHVLHQQYKDVPKSDWVKFMRVLQRQLLEDHLKRRFQDKSLDCYLHQTIGRILGIYKVEDEDDYDDDEDSDSEGEERPCGLCPDTQRNMATTECENCHQPVCEQHLQPVSENCECGKGRKG